MFVSTHLLSSASGQQFQLAQSPPFSILATATTKVVSHVTVSPSAKGSQSKLILCEVIART